MTKGTTKLRRLVEPFFVNTENPRRSADTLIDYLAALVTTTLLVERRVSIRRLGMFELVPTPTKGPFKEGWRVLFTPSDFLKKQIKEKFNGRSELQPRAGKVGRRHEEA